MRTNNLSLILLIILAFYSCREDNAYQLPNDSYINFSNSDGITRGEIKTQFDNNDEFHVIVFEGTIGSATNTRLWGHNIKKQGDEWTYNSGNYEPWGTTKSIVSQAYYPSNLNKSIIERIYPNKSLQHGMIFNCPINVDDQIDLIAAQAETSHRQRVDLRFKHILSKIGFELSFPTNNEIRVDGIHINYHQIQRKGTYTFHTDVWSDSGLPEDDYPAGSTTTMAGSSPTVVPLGDTAVVNMTSNPLIIIPQNIDGTHNMSIVVEYSVPNGNGGWTTFTTSEKVMPAPNNKYEKGKSYLYTMEIIGKEITILKGSINIEPNTTEDIIAGNLNTDLLLDPTAATNRLELMLKDGVRDFIVVGSNNSVLINWNGLAPMEVAEKNLNLNLDDPNNFYSVDISRLSNYPYNATLGGYEMFAGQFFVKGKWQGGRANSCLDEVIYRDNIVKIGGNAFQNNGNLKTVELSEVKEADSYSFANCGKLTDLDMGNLKKVGEHGFGGCKILTRKAGTATPPLETVGKYGFQFCHNLKLEDASFKNITSLGEASFQSCSALDNYVVMNNYTDSLPKLLFQYCTNLRGITAKQCIGAAEYFITACNKLEIFELPNVATNYQGKESGTGTPNRYLTNEIDAAKNTLEIIDLNSATDVTTVQVNNIGKYPKLRILRLGAMTQVVGDGAFQNSNKIEEVIFTSVPTVNNNAFNGCINLHKAEFSKLSTVGNASFKGCKILDSVDIGLLKRVNSETFRGCEALTLEPGSDSPELEYVGANGFHNCKKIKLEDKSFKNITHLGDLAFRSCYNLDNHVIMNNLTGAIGKDAFHDCYELRGLTAEKCTLAKEYFITGCSKLKVFEMPSVLKNVYKFTGKTVKITEALSTSKAQLEIIDLNSADDITKDQLSTIAKYPNLKILRLGAMKAEVSWQAFQNNTTIEEAIFSSVTFVGYGAFHGCTNLKRLDLSGMTAEPTNTPFSNGSVNVDMLGCTLRLNPAQAARAIANGNKWGGATFGSIVTTPVATDISR